MKCGRRSNITEIYYIQNEKQYKRLLINLIRENYISPDEFQEIIYGCDCLNAEDGCSYCEADDCLLIEHLNDKDITEHIELWGEDMDFPAILVLADTYCRDEKFTLTTIRNAKENTRYGYNGDW